MSNNKMFSRGYDVVREKIYSNPYYARSCFNCAYYYQSVGDKEEVCQKENVLQYDMVITDNNVYCLKWRYCDADLSKNNMFKRGRSILE